MHLRPIGPPFCTLTITHGLYRIDSSYHLEHVMPCSFTDERHPFFKGGGESVADDVIASD